MTHLIFVGRSSMGLPQLLFHLLWILVVGCSLAAAPVSALQVGKPTHIVNVHRPQQDQYKMGYRPIFVDVQRLSTDLSKPETITVGFSSGYYNDRSSTFSTEGVIPKGQTKVRIELIYKWSSSYGSRLVVSNDGSLSSISRAALLYDSLEGWTGNTVTSAEDEYTFLYVSPDPAVQSFGNSTMTKTVGLETSPVLTRNTLNVLEGPLPTFDALSELLNHQATSNEGNYVRLNQKTANSNEALMAIRNYRHLIAGSFDFLPSSPVGLHLVDFVIISVDELQALAKASPAKTEALRKWVGMGGVLIVSNCGVDYSGLPSVIPNLSSNQEPALPRDRIQNWQVFDSLPEEPRQILSSFQQRRPELNDGGSTVYYGYSDANETTGASWLAGIGKGFKTRQISGRLNNLSSLIEQSQSPLAYSDYGLGRILATSSDLSDYKQSDWGLLLGQAYGEERASVANQFGSRNAYFGNISGFQVPNVGEPPKLTFLGLITLFALVVGPVMFVWLNRVNRLNLLLFLIPALSFVSVIALVGYVIVADGFAFRSNRLSVTYLDSNNQTATTQTIQAIYSGSTPQGYRFDIDTFMATNSAADRRRTVVTESSEDWYLTGARIAVRTKHHVTTLKNESSDRKLILKTSSGPLQDLSSVDWTSDLQLNNQLGIPIQAVYLRTPQGFLVAENLAADAVNQPLQPGDGVAADVRQLYADCRENVVMDYYSRSGSYGYYYDRLSHVEVLDGSERVDVSKIGLVGDSFSRLKNLAELNYLKPGEYFCVCQETPWATQLQDNAEYVSQLHLVFGQCEVK